MQPMQTIPVLQVTYSVVVTNSNGCSITSAGFLRLLQMHSTASIGGNASFCGFKHGAQFQCNNGVGCDISDLNDNNILNATNHSLYRKCCRYYAVVDTANNGCSIT
jgi:hypothetical protein